MGRLTSPVPKPRLSPLAVALRVGFAAALSAAILAVSCAALFVTHTPRIVSLLLEPFSLLLVPGLLIAFLAAGTSDFSPILVLRVSSVFYFLLFLLLALRRRRVHTPSR